MQKNADLSYEDIYMAIDKVNSTNNAQAISGVRKANLKATKSNKAQALGEDRIDINSYKTSSFKSAYKKAMKIIEETPDVRLEKIAELKAKIKDIKNPSNEVLEAVAEKILKDLNLS